MVKRTVSLFIALILVLSVGLKNVNAANFDVLQSTGYNVRVDGAAASNFINGVHPSFAADIDGNGKNDLIIISSTASNNGRSSSGSVWVVYDSITERLSGTGNQIDLSDSSKYNLRFDGPVANASVGYTVTVADLNGDGSQDIIIGGTSDNNSRTDSGSVYVIYSSVFKNINGTGNNIDLAITTNYNLRFDGAVAADYLGNSQLLVSDLNGDGSQDLLMSEHGAGFNSRAASGSLYVVYNSILTSYSGTGNNIDLSTSTNYNLRFDGAVAGDNFGISELAVENLDTDGKRDLVVGAINTDYNSRNNSGSLYVIYNTLVRNYSGTGNNIDMSSSTNYNIRYDGAVVNYKLSDVNSSLKDVDNDGKVDITIGDRAAGFNSRATSGSLYVLFNTLIDDYSGTGNNVDLATTTNFNVRFDGAVAGDAFGYQSVVDDFNGDGKNDIVTSAYNTDFNSRNDSGSVYVIYNDKIPSSGTGNLVDMATTTNYNVRYDGAVASDYFGFFMGFEDINNDGQKEIVSAGLLVSNNSRSNSGSIWYPYNFPHTLTTTSSSRNASNVQIVGNVTALNSMTNISGVQYLIDSNDPNGSWSSCTANDGSFNSTSELFTCNISYAPTSGGHSIYVRAYDSNTSYTASQNYQVFKYGYDQSSSDAVDYIFSAPKPVSIIDKGNVTLLVGYGTFKYAVKLQTEELLKSGVYKIPNTNYWQAGPKQGVWWKSSYNNANLAPSEIERAFTVIFKYNPSSLEKSISEKSLKLAYSPDGKTWKIMQSILDTKKKEMVVVTKKGGYYMIVGGTNKIYSGPKVQGAKTQKLETSIPAVVPQVSQP